MERINKVKQFIRFKGVKIFKPYDCRDCVFCRRIEDCNYDHCEFLNTYVNYGFSNDTPETTENRKCVFVKKYRAIKLKPPELGDIGVIEGNIDYDYVNKVIKESKM